LLKDFEETRRRADFEFERIERQTREYQAQSDRSNAEYERFRAQSDRSNAEYERSRAEFERYFGERKANEEVKRAREAAQETERLVLKQAEEAQREKERLAVEVDLLAAHTKNYLFAVVVGGAIAAFFMHLVRKKRRNPEGQMKYSEKFGVVVTVASALLIFLALAVSSDWQPHLDFFQNVMFSLDLRFFRKEGISSEYLIDIATRYVIWILLCTGAYGILTYLGITPPAWKPKGLADSDANDAASNA